MTVESSVQADLLFNGSMGGTDGIGMCAFDFARLFRQAENASRRGDFPTPALFTQCFNGILHATVLKFVAHADPLTRRRG